MTTPTSKGCPHCGGELRTLDGPWVPLVSIPLAFVRQVALVFAAGIILAMAIILWPVTCAKCGAVPLGKMSPKARRTMIAKKAFVAFLLVVILCAAQACLNAVKQLGPDAFKG